MADLIRAWMAGLGANTAIAITCAVNTLIGGAGGLYIRELYRRYGSPLSNRESFGNLFPILTAITVVIIFVVKSSLALSLGLVGALSIVRFRTAIKNPEELIYLFLCIGVGVALGAELRLLTFLSLAVISAFIIGRSFFGQANGPHQLMLTVSGEARAFFETTEPDVVGVLKQRLKNVNLQRLDVEDGHVQFRATVSLRDADEVTALVSDLQKKLPRFDVSYVNLESLL